MAKVTYLADTEGRPVTVFGVTFVPGEAQDEADHATLLKLEANPDFRVEWEDGEKERAGAPVPEPEAGHVETFKALWGRMTPEERDAAAEFVTAPSEDPDPLPDDKPGRGHRRRS